jgi:hypothetical protein
MASFTLDRRSRQAKKMYGSRRFSAKGWFAYFRVYGPEQAAFDGSWKPADLEEVK